MNKSKLGGSFIGFPITEVDTKRNESEHFDFQDIHKTAKQIESVYSDNLFAFNKWQQPNNNNNPNVIQIIF
jgi:hypothetical protein